MKISQSFRAFVALGLSVVIFDSVQAAPKIGVLLKGRSGFWSAVEKGALEAGQAHGAELIVKTPPAESDISIQIQLLNGLVAQGVNAVVIAPSSKDALAGPVAAALAKGVKVVVIDSPIEGDMPVFVSTDHADAGTAAGKLLATLVEDSDEISFLRHSQTGGATLIREVGAFNAIREVFPNIVVHRDIFGGAEAGEEEQKARLLLSQHPGTKAILASGTPGTMAMLKVLQSIAPRTSIKLVGFGFNLNHHVAAALDEGTLHGWIAQLPTVVGAKGVEAAVALLEGRTLPANIPCDFLIVTKANLNEPQVQALLPQ